jgi:hypothetical protein
MIDDDMGTSPTLLHGLVCVECGRRDDGRRRWALRLTVDGELAAFCPECDARAFTEVT